MEYNALNIKIIQDPQRNVECYLFSEKPIKEKEAKALCKAHYETLDMFLCMQPLLVVHGNEEKAPFGEGSVSATAKLMIPSLLKPPYDLYLLNTFAMELLGGKTIPEKFANLMEFNAEETEKDFLIEFINRLTDKGLYVVSCLNNIDGEPSPKAY